MTESAERIPHHSGTQPGWSVEACAVLEDHPIQIEGQLYTTKWKTVEFNPAVVGVPAGRRDFDEYLKFGLMSYPAAQALRWWFIASLDVIHKTAIRTRLVRHEVKYERSARRVAEYDTVDTFEENRTAHNCK